MIVSGSAMTIFYLFIPNPKRFHWA